MPLQTTNLAVKERIRQPVFLALDNVCEESIQEANGYLEVCARNGSIVMVTARTIDVLHRLGIDETDCLEMPELDEEDAKQLFLYHAACGVKFFSEDDNQKVLHCVKQCKFHKGANMGEHFHPLALQVLGAQLRSLGSDPSIWMENLQQKHNFNQFGEEHPIFNVLRGAYDSLLEEDQLLFMDIVLFNSSQKSTGFYHVNPLLGDMRQMFYLDIYQWLSIVHGVQVQIVKDRVRTLSPYSHDEVITSWVQCFLRIAHVHECVNGLIKFWFHVCGNCSCKVSRPSHYFKIPVTLPMV